MILLPPPHHPEPHTYLWTHEELKAIVDYGRKCYEAGTAEQTECKAALAQPVQPATQQREDAEPVLPRHLPESMCKDEMLKYYADYSNLVSHEAVLYQKRIRDLEKLVAAHPPKRQQMTDKEIYEAWKAHPDFEDITPYAFDQGVKCSEQHHKIGEPK